MVIDNPRCYLAQALIRECLRRHIALLICDEKHSPQLLCESIYGQTQRLGILCSQMKADSKNKQRLWRKIVVQKINNQADCLELSGKQPSKDLTAMTRQITAGDRRNVEAAAAKIYFRALFGAGFKRGRTSDLPNASLNYGYAIVRMLIRREIVIHGMEPCLGVKHASAENPFNLSDDLIEPYRPFVDEWALSHVMDGAHTELTRDDRKTMINLLTEKCVIDGKVCCIADAIKITVQSYMACLKDKSASPLKLPRFIKGGH